MDSEFPMSTSVLIGVAGLEWKVLSYLETPFSSHDNTLHPHLPHMLTH